VVIARIHCCTTSRNARTSSKFSSRTNPVTSVDVADPLATVFPAIAELAGVVDITCRLTAITDEFACGTDTGAVQKIDAFAAVTVAWAELAYIV